MLKQTQWSPDTCKCVLIYEWDTDTKEADRVHTPVSGTPCAAHAEYTDTTEHHAAVLKENQTKNQAIEEACQAVPRLLPEHFTFSFDKTRKLNLSIHTLTDTELTNVQAAVGRKFLSNTLQVSKH